MLPEAGWPRWQQHSRAISRTWEPGDEIVVTRLDHDANVTPWVLAAEDAGVEIRYVPFQDDNYTLDMERFRDCINENTRLVAVGAASNATGGINPLAEISEIAHEAGALVFVDAVHYGPHDLIDVQAWDCDFLCCSAYKFFGPHLGIMWGRRELLEQLEAYKVRPAENEIPGKWMTGTQSFESIAAGMACVDYIASLGEAPVETDRRAKLISAFEKIREYESELTQSFLEQVATMPEIKVWGITESNQMDHRFSTFSITHNQIPTGRLAELLSEAGIFVWHGNYYALQFTEALNLEPEGMVRIGMVHYNTLDEVNRLVEVLKHIDQQALAGAE